MEKICDPNLVSWGYSAWFIGCEGNGSFFEQVQTTVEIDDSELIYMIKMLRTGWSEVLYLHLKFISTFYNHGIQVTVAH
jgi:hypothetical protein